jgi:hypothetical protein
MPSSGDLAGLLLEIASGVADDAWSARLREFAAAVPPGVPVDFQARPKRHAPRDNAIQQLAIEQFSGVDLRRAAEEIAKDIRRYGSTRWRFDQTRAVMPSQYTKDPVRARLFEAFQSAGGDVPTSPKQIERIIKPLFHKENSGQVAMSAAAVSLAAKENIAMPEATALKPADQKLLQAVVESGPGKAAAARLAAEELAERERLVAAIDSLTKQQLERRPEATGAQADLVAELKAARAKVLELERKAHGSAHAMLAASFSYQAQCDDMRHRLRQTASPLIKPFIREMWDEMEKTRKEQLRTSSAWTTHSVVTGKKIDSGQTNMPAIILRMHAIRRAIEDAEELYFVPDQSGIAARLDALKRGLPSTEAFSAGPKFGSSALLNDLNTGVDVEAALKKHCEDGALAVLRNYRAAQKQGANG